MDATSWRRRSSSPCPPGAAWGPWGQLTILLGGAAHSRRAAQPLGRLAAQGLAWRLRCGPREARPTSPTLASCGVPTPQVSAEDLKYAEDFGLKLDEIYPVFKNILTEGWEFLFDPEVEEAGLFVQRMRKWEQGIGGDKKAVIEWDLEGEQQPFVGENKHD